MYGLPAQVSGAIRPFASDGNFAHLECGNGTGQEEPRALSGRGRNRSRVKPPTIHGFEQNQKTHIPHINFTYVTYVYNYLFLVEHVSWTCHHGYCEHHCFFIIIIIIILVAPNWLLRNSTSLPWSDVVIRRRHVRGWRSATQRHSGHLEETMFQVDGWLSVLFLFPAFRAPNQAVNLRSVIRQSNLILT